MSNFKVSPNWLTILEQNSNDTNMTKNLFFIFCRIHCTRLSIWQLQTIQYQNCTKLGYVSWIVEMPSLSSFGKTFKYYWWPYLTDIITWTLSSVIWFWFLIIFPHLLFDVIEKYKKSNSEKSNMQSLLGVFWPNVFSLAELVLTATELWQQKNSASDL